MGDGYATHVRRAEQLIGLRRYDEAERSARSAIECDPSKAGGWLHLGWAKYRRGGQGDEALEVIEKGLAREPDNVWAHRLRSGILTQLRRHKEALEAAETALQLAPESSLAHHRRAACLTNLNQHEEALVAIDRSLELDSEEASAHETRAGILLRLGRLYQAVEAAETSVQLDPESVSALERLGDCLDRVDEAEAAVRAFHRAVKTDPTGNYAKKRLLEVADQELGNFLTEGFAWFLLVSTMAVITAAFWGWLFLVIPPGFLVTFYKRYQRVKAESDARWETVSPGVSDVLQVLREEKRRG